MPHPPVTLQQIADRAKVTRATVSMALRNSPKVSRATRLAIQDLARSMGYRPNPLVSSLMTSLRAHKPPRYRATVAFLTNYEDRDAWRGWPTYPEYFSGAVERGASLGYRVEHFWLGDYRSDPERLVGVFHARGISGTLIPPLPRGDSTLAFDLSGFSAVAFDYTLARPNLPRVCCNHVQTVGLAFSKLRERGYRRIGFVMHPNDVECANYMWIAGVTVARERQPDLDIRVFPAAKDWSERAFRAWFRREKPDVIVCVTLEVCEWTRRLEILIPEKLGLLHLDCQRDWTMAGMYQHPSRLGSAAMEMLASYLESNLQIDLEEPRVVLINSDFRDGETIRPQNSA